MNLIIQKTIRQNIERFTLVYMNDTDSDVLFFQRLKMFI